MIEIKNIKKTCLCNGSKRTIFSEFDLSIRKGDKIGLFGPNGAGKSTLMNILAGVDRNYTGFVSIDKKRVSYMHQNPTSTLAPWFTCKKNILLIRKYHDLDIEKGKTFLNQLIKELEIDFSLDLYPFELSGGERQIVTLLRALIFEPDVLLLDEPFSALDVKKRSSFLELLKKYFSNDLIVIISSHRGDEVKLLLNRAIVMKHHSATKITKDIFLSKTVSKQKFEQIISKIGFNGNRKKI